MPALKNKDCELHLDIDFEFGRNSADPFIGRQTSFAVGPTLPRTVIVTSKPGGLLASS